jgi:hypothetical protein
MSMKEWCATKEKERIAELVAYFDGVAGLANFMEVPFSTAYSWSVRGRISRRYAAIAEKKTAGRFAAGYLKPSAMEWFQETNKAGR